jgi:hypothetical protein
MIRLGEDFETRFFISDHKDTYIHDGINYSFCTDIKKLRQLFQLYCSGQL